MDVTGQRSRAVGAKVPTVVGFHHGSATVAVELRLARHVADILPAVSAVARPRTDLAAVFPARNRQQARLAHEAIALLAWAHNTTTPDEPKP